MRIDNLRKLAESEETVGEVLEALKDDFVIVDDIADKMKKDISGNPETIRVSLSKLGGAHSNLLTAWGIVESAKTNTQLTYYYEAKTAMTNDSPGKKFNATATKEEARAQVLNLRRIRNYIDAYVKSASVNITVLQSLKKREEQNRQTPGE